MAKPTSVTIIDSNGSEHQRKRAWAERKREAGLCFLGGDGKYHFRAHPQHNDGAGSVSSLTLTQRRDHRVSVCDLRAPWRPNQPTSGHDSFLPYPYPNQTSAAVRSLAARYPGLAIGTRAR